MIRKNKRDISPGRIRNVSKPIDSYSPHKNSQPLLSPKVVPCSTLQSSKLDSLQQSFGRMNATLNSLFDRSIADKFRNDQSLSINQCLNGFEGQANKIQSKLDKPILILKSIQTEVLNKISLKRKNNSSNTNNECSVRFQQLQNRLRKLQAMMK